MKRQGASPRASLVADRHGRRREARTAGQDQGAGRLIPRIHIIHVRESQDSACRDSQSAVRQEFRGPERPLRKRSGCRGCGHRRSGIVRKDDPPPRCWNGSVEEEARGESRTHFPPTGPVVPGLRAGSAKSEFEAAMFRRKLAIGSPAKSRDFGGSPVRGPTLGRKALFGTQGTDRGRKAPAGTPSKESARAFTGRVAT